MVNIRSKTVMKELNKLSVYAKNNKDHPVEQIDLLKQNILKFGFTTPFLISKDNVLIAGHGRKLACDQLGIKQVPCIVIDDLSEDEMKALRIADNRVGELGETNWAFVKEEWLELKDSGLDFLTGYVEEDFLDMDEEPGEVKEDDFDVPDEDKIETTIKRGDIIQLGNHRLMCGDSTGNDVKTLMDNKKANMILTDPPYGVDYDGINNDDRKGLRDLLVGAFTNMAEYTDKGGSCYVFHSDKCADIFNEVYRDFFHFSSMVIWVKPSLTLSQTDYQSRHEPCLYGWVLGGTHNWYSDRLQTSIWEFGRENVEGHTTPKPVELLANALNNSSKQGQTVLDLFGGSGSTLIACEQLNRVCYMMELDEKYCEVICQRWEKQTGKTREVLND